MAHIITTNDGENHILLQFRDFTDLVEKAIGIEAAEWLTDYLAETYGEEAEIEAIMEDCEKELQGHRDKYRATMGEIHEEAKKLAGLINAPTLDRKAISNTAGRISAIAYREVSRRY